MKADLKDITANRTSVSEGGEEFYNDRVSDMNSAFCWWANIKLLRKRQLCRVCI